MRSLALKLTLAFLCVGVIAVALVGIFVGLRVQNAYNRWLADQRVASLAAMLESYYQVNGSWAGVGEVLRQSGMGHGMMDLRNLSVALLDADGRVLLARRPAGKPMAGLWEFPGGKVKEGETCERALIRELKEELGIDTAESCLAPFTFASHRYIDFHLLMPLFVCRVWKGSPLPREGQELAWVEPRRLPDYPMPPADRPLVASDAFRTP